MSAAGIDDILRSVGIDPDGIDGITELDKRQLQTNRTSASVSVPSAADHGLVGNIDKTVSVCLLESDDELILISRINK